MFGWKNGRVAPLISALAMALLVSACQPFAGGALKKSSFALSSLDCPTVTGGVIPVYPSAGANWNDYVRVDNSQLDVFSQPDQACDGSESNYASCIHGGEKRMVVVSGRDSCTGLSASDELGAFDWVCRATKKGAAFYSVGLKAGKGLRDLVTENGFLPNSVRVYQTGCDSPVVETLPGSWWDNAVLPLPENSAASDPSISLVSSPGAGPIYVLAGSRGSSGLSLESDRLSLVTLGDSVLSYSGNPAQNCDPAIGERGTGEIALVCGGSRQFLWIEGRFENAASVPATTTLRLHDTRFVNIHRSHADPIAMDGGATNVITESQ